MTDPITAPAIHALFCRSGSGLDRNSGLGLGVASILLAELGVASITAILLVDTPNCSVGDATRVGVGTTSVGVTLRAGVGVADVRVLNDVVVAGNSR